MARGFLLWIDSDSWSKKIQAIEYIYELTASLMTHPRFYKFAILTNLFVCIGTFIPLVGHIDNPKYRYLVYDIIHLPAYWLTKIVDWKLGDAEVLSTWNSYSLVGPLLNLFSCSAWILLFLFVVNRFKATSSIKTPSNNFWKSVYKLNLIIAFIMFLAWLPMTDEFIKGISNKIIGDILFIIFIPFVFPGFVTNFIGTQFLESGGDTVFGFTDMTLVSKLATGFGVTIVCIALFIIKVKLFKDSKASSPQPVVRST